MSFPRFASFVGLVLVGALLGPALALQSEALYTAYLPLIVVGKASTTLPTVAVTVVKPPLPPLPSQTVTSTLTAPATPASTATTRPPVIWPTATHTPWSTATRDRPPIIWPTPRPTNTPSPTPLPGAVLTLNAIADTFLTEGRADSVWGGYPGLFVGYDDQGWRRQRALIRFDMTELPRDVAVLAATLQVYIHNCFECRKIEVTTYRVTNPWDEETATWNTVAQSVGEAHGLADFDPRDGRHWVSFDIIQLVRHWQDGTPNFGVMLRGGEEPVSQDPLLYDFWGIEARESLTKAPRLVIRWLPR
jgi:hypothetical protein